MTYVVQTNKLTKTIGEKNLVTNVSMHVKKGEIYGFLGPNGAGKTTVMKLLTNLWKPTEGSIELFGEKLTSTSYVVLKRMGCMIEFPAGSRPLVGSSKIKSSGLHNTARASPNRCFIPREYSRTDFFPVLFKPNSSMAFSILPVL